MLCGEDGYIDGCESLPPGLQIAEKMVVISSSRGYVNPSNPCTSPCSNRNTNSISTKLHTVHTTLSKSPKKKKKKIKVLRETPDQNWDQKTGVKTRIRSFLNGGQNPFRSYKTSKCDKNPWISPCFGVSLPSYPPVFQRIFHPPWSLGSLGSLGPSSNSARGSGRT